MRIADICKLCRNSHASCLGGHNASCGLRPGNRLSKPRGPGNMPAGRWRLAAKQTTPYRPDAVTAATLFSLPPMPINRQRLNSGMSFAHACEWKPDLGTRLLVVSKADWSQRWYQLPPSCMFHTSTRGRMVGTCSACSRPVRCHLADDACSRMALHPVCAR